MHINKFNVKYILCFSTINFCISIYLVFNYYPPSFNNSPEKKDMRSNILDGCYHVYLDVGSNVGIQIRKLFEPSKYPDAAVHPIYDLNFGTFENRQRDGNDYKVCAVGFEPNFQHTAYLKNLEKIYNGCGWKVKIYTDTAVSDHNGAATFFFSRLEIFYATYRYHVV